MASHAHGPGDSGSKLALYGSIGTALIVAAAFIIVGMMNHDPVFPVSTTSSTPAPGPPPKPDYVSFNKLQMNETGGVTVSGVAEKDVNATGVVVAIGPKPSGGYWSGFGNVLGQHWQADVAIDPPWQNYTISAAYYYGRPGGAPPVPKATSEPAVPAVAPAGRLVSETTRQSALMVAFDPGPTTSPPPPPDQLVTCVEQFGPSCFNGPEFGPPSVYQPNQ